MHGLFASEKIEVLVDPLSKFIKQPCHSAKLCTPQSSGKNVTSVCIVGMRELIHIIGLHPEV